VERSERNAVQEYLSYFWALLKGNVTRRRVPIWVTLCVTNRCNLRCRYCYESDYDRTRDEMTTEEILRLIDELYAMGTRYISVNGGEALLRDDLEQIVDKIKSKRILCHLSTNGLLVPQRISLLRKVDSIAISLDGREEDNDLNRGKGSYQKIIAAFDALKKEEIPFHVHTVLTRQNKDALEELMPLAKEYGFRVQFSPLRKQDSPDQTIGLDDEELKAVVAKILEQKKQGAPVFFSRQAYENLLHWPFPYEQQMIYGALPPGYHPIPCAFKDFACHIEANGMVYPCIVLVKKFPAKSVKDVGMRQAWEHLASNKCVACYNVCCTDMNMIFGLKFPSLLNAIGVVFERLRHRP